jgi:hypothetical protein
LDKDSKRGVKNYTVHLLKGTFEKEDAINLLTKMIDAKIKYHEEKIFKTDNEEDIKMREQRIRQLQRELYEARVFIEKKGKMIEINADICL